MSMFMETLDLWGAHCALLASCGTKDESVLTMGTKYFVAFTSISSFLYFFSFDSQRSNSRREWLKVFDWSYERSIELLHSKDGF